MMLKNDKQVTIWIVISASLILIWFVGRGDDKQQITEEIKERWNAAYIHHIEILENDKSVAFVQTADGTEKEVYLEKSLFSWENKKDFSFGPPEETNGPIFLSFFDSPFSKEEKNAVLLRVFDNEVDSVRIVNGEDKVHDFKLFSMDSGKRFGLFTTESDAIYEAEFIAYNSEGEVMTSIKLQQ